VQVRAVPLPSGNVSLVVNDENAAGDGRVLRLLTFDPGGERLARTQVPLGTDDRWVRDQGPVVATRDGKVATIAQVERDGGCRCDGYRLMVFDADTGSIVHDRVELSSGGAGAWSFDSSLRHLAAAPGGIYFHGRYNRPDQASYEAARAEPLPIGKPYAKAGTWLY
jgi:hypothetical protein